MGSIVGVRIDAVVHLEQLKLIQFCWLLRSKYLELKLSLDATLSPTGLAVTLYRSNLEQPIFSLTNFVTEIFHFPKI